jgi:hypothetical protein
LGTGYAQGGAIAVVMTIVVLILRGHLVPASVVREIRADRDARIAEISAERDTWRTACQERTESLYLTQGQVGELLELSRTANHVLASLPRALEEVASGPKGKKVAP